METLNSVEREREREGREHSSVCLHCRSVWCRGGARSYTGCGLALLVLRGGAPGFSTRGAWGTGSAGSAGGCRLALLVVGGGVPGLGPRCAGGDGSRRLDLQEKVNFSKRYIFIISVVAKQAKICTHVTPSLTFSSESF